MPAVLDRREPVTLDTVDKLVEVADTRSKRSATVQVALLAIALTSLFAWRATRMAAAQPRAAPESLAAARAQSRMRGSFAGLQWQTTRKMTHRSAITPAVNPIDAMPVILPDRGAPASLPPASTGAVAHDGAFGVLGIDGK